MFELTLMEKLQVIGKYEIEQKTPYSERVTDWYGDGNMYEPKLHISEEKIEEAFYKAVRELELKWKLIDGESGYDSSFSPEEKKLLSRIDEMLVCFGRESNKTESLEWRTDLSDWEKDILTSWDESYKREMIKLINAIEKFPDYDEAEI